MLKLQIWVKIAPQLDVREVGRAVDTLSVVNNLRAMVILREKGLSD